MSIFDRLSTQSKILNISHSDLDGISSSIVLGNTFQAKNISYQYTDYNKIDELLQAINFKDYDFVILTDISPNKLSLDDLPENLILLDHHDSAIHLHDPKKFRFVVTKNCGAVLAMKFCEKVLGVDLSYLRKLIYHTNDYDLWIHKSPFSKDLNYLFYLYWEDKMRKRFFDGNMELDDNEKQFLKNRHDTFNKLWDDFTYVTIEDFSGLIFSTDDFINELSHKAMTELDIEYSFCINEKTKNISVRTTNENIHLGNILKELGLGGGHPKSAAMNPVEIVNLYDNIDKVVTRIKQDTD